MARHDGAVSFPFLPPDALGFRVLRSVALAAILVGTLSGCFTVQMDLQIRDDDTVDGSVLVAFDRQVVQRAGGDQALLKALRGSDARVLDEPPSSGSVHVREYRDGDRVGVEYVLSAIPITDFSTGSSGRDGAMQEFSIQRVQDTFVVDGRIHGEALLSDDTNGRTTKNLESADIAISVTFPGEVEEANGEVNGRTVTWNPSAARPVEIHAVGAATGGFPRGALIGLSVLAILGALAVIGFVGWRGRPAVRE